jgi:Zn-finger nucleic acid-binding protein
MRQHKRNGVAIEQCTKCHGIFLDRGELEQLIGAESSFLGRDLRASETGEGAG